MKGSPAVASVLCCWAHLNHSVKSHDGVVQARLVAAHVFMVGSRNTAIISASGLYCE